MSESTLTDNALEILKKRYFCKDAEGNIQEDWEGLCRRVAKFVAQAESGNSQDWFDTFFDMMYNLRFLPNSPTLFNAGVEGGLGNLSACFVLPIEDSLEGIFDTLSNAVKIFASGGGCGYDFSQLRKRGSSVSKTNGVSSGPVSFIHAYNAATDVIKQGGKRRGANMGVLRVDHPDIEEFIDSKTEEGALSNFNLSVAVTDEFMHAVVTGRQEGILTGDGFDLYDRYADKVDRTVSATELFNKIVQHAWANGEPGILFIDEINRRHPLNGLGDISGVNPCGEQPLLSNESCNLGAINIAQFHTVDARNNPQVHWDRLKEIIPLAVRFLDDVVYMNKYPVFAIEDMTNKTRKIGLGIMGWADLLLHLKIAYDSDDAIHLADRLMEFIEYYALEASMKLAEERGSFAAFEHRKYIDPYSSSWGGRLAWDELTPQIKAVGLRNACVTTIAPTGSLSLIAGVSSGIEPVFQWEYTYHRVDKEFTEQHPLAAPYLKRGDNLPKYFVTALEVEPFWHVRMQSAFQKWVDAGISKTINMPFEATQEDVTKAIIEAWEFKCKGVTLYRSGSRQQEVLVAKEREGNTTPPIGISPRKRPRLTVGKTLRIPVGDTCGSLFITVNHDDIGPCESFVALGRGGGCISSHVEALGRLVSLALRSGIDYTEIVDQLSGIRCSKARWEEGRSIHSCPDAVALALRELIGGEKNAALEESAQLLTYVPGVVGLGENPECPECHHMLYREGSCVHCPICGYSKCV